MASVTAHRIEHSIEEDRPVAGWARRHLGPKTSTELALFAAAVLLIVGAAVVGVLALLVRSHHALQGIDDAVAPWGTEHATDAARTVLDVVTSFGSTLVLVIAIAAVTVVEMIRRPSRWLPVFLIVVALGQPLLTNEVKDLVARVRPTVDAHAAALGPSFPSGHSAGAAACFAAIALVLGRGRSPRAHAVLAGLAVFVAVAVAASRVLLGVHWFSDVIGGLAIGWAWFALCAIAFGGRVLRFGAPVEAAERTIDAHSTS